MAQVQLQDVHKSFGATEVIRGVSLDIAQGEFVVFVGPSGCGKSTLLRMISGLEDVSNGSIHIGGRDVTHVPPSRRELAMVFQSYALFPHLTVAENIGFGLKLSKTPRAEIKRRVQEVASTLQLDNLLERTPRQLSGGQRQRVAIGRSIIRNPKVFLFDEPLSNLDAALRVQMRLEISRLHKELQNVTMVYVTHDQVEAMTLADRIVVINNGQIEQIGTPMELYSKPANPFVAGFIGAPAMNFVDGDVDSSGKVGTGNVRIAPSKKTSVRGEAIIGFRPEHLTITKESSADFSASVELIEKLGAETLVYLTSPFSKTPVTLRLDGECPVAEGQVVSIRIDRSKLHIFPR